MEYGLQVYWGQKGNFFFNFGFYFKPEAACDITMIKYKTYELEKTMVDNTTLYNLQIKHTTLS